MRILFFILALFLLLGLYLCNAGDIGYQASKLSEAIFHSPWHAVPPTVRTRRNMRSIVLIAMAQAQRPLVMKAFKMIELTHGNFLVVMKYTYSVFALLYARSKQP